MNGVLLIDEGFSNRGIDRLSPGFKLEIMIKNSETICDQNGIEILVSYHHEQSPSQKEFCHGEHEVGLMIYTELTSVEVVIKGKGIDILPMMTDKQKDFVIGQLQYE